MDYWDNNETIIGIIIQSWDNRFWILTVSNHRSFLSLRLIFLLGNIIYWIIIIGILLIFINNRYSYNDNPKECQILYVFLLDCCDPFFRVQFFIPKLIIKQQGF